MVSWSRSFLARMTQAPTVLKRSSTLPSSNWSGVPALKVLGGSDSTLGNRKRTVPRSMATRDALRVHQARPIQLPKRKTRRVLPPFAGGLGGAGLGGSAGLGGAAAGALGVTEVEAGGFAGALAAAGGLSLAGGVGSAMRGISFRSNSVRGKAARPTARELCSCLRGVVNVFSQGENRELVSK